MIFGIGIMLIILGVFQAIGIGAKIIKDGGSYPQTQNDKDLATIGRIIALILIVSAGIYLVCV